MSQEDTGPQGEGSTGNGEEAPAPPMNRAERRAAGKKGATQAQRPGFRGPTMAGRGSGVQIIANQTRGSNRGK